MQRSSKYLFTRSDDGDVVIGGEKFTLNVNWSQLSTVGNFSIDAPQVSMDALLCADMQIFTEAVCRPRSARTVRP